MGLMNSVGHMMATDSVEAQGQQLELFLSMANTTEKATVDTGHMELFNAISNDIGLVSLDKNGIYVKTLLDNLITKTILKKDRGLVIDEAISMLKTNTTDFFGTDTRSLIASSPNYNEYNEKAECTFTYVDDGLRDYALADGFTTRYESTKYKSGSMSLYEKLKMRDLAKDIDKLMVEKESNV